MEASEEIQNLKQKLSIQMEKCNTFEVQQNVLMDILDIPPEKRNFLSLREGLENLKNDYVNEKERADNLACHQMPIPQPSESRNVGLNTPKETPNRGPAIHSTPAVMVGLEGRGVTNQVNRMILSTSNPPEQSPIPARQGLISPLMVRTPQRSRTFTNAPAQSPMHLNAPERSGSATSQIRSPYFQSLQQDGGGKSPKIIHYQGNLHLLISTLLVK